MSQTPQVTEVRHPLDRFFSPHSIAIIGASPDASKIRGLLQSLLQKNGYPGRLYPVNPSYREINGVPCFPSVEAELWPKLGDGHVRKAAYRGG